MIFSIESLALIILGLSLLGIVIVVIRKFPMLAAIDPGTMVSPLAKRKASIIEDRLKRKFKTGWSTVAAVSQPISQKIKTIWSVGHKKLVDLEHEYKVRSLPVFLNRHQRQKVNKEIQSLLDQAEALIVDEEFSAAEAKVLQAIRLEPRSVPAFECLGRIYVANKQLDFALETYNYLLKLNSEHDSIHDHQPLAAGNLDHPDGKHHDSIDNPPVKDIYSYYLELAKIFRAKEDWSNAFKQIEEAARREPNNPKILDEYIEISINAGKKQFAESALRTLAASNPENSKIEGWQERIAAINMVTK